MIVASLLLILVAVTLLVLGLTGGSSTLLTSSIVASLLAAVALVIGARQNAAARRAAAGAPADDEPRAGGFFAEEYPPASGPFAPGPEFSDRRETVQFDGPGADHPLDPHDGYDHAFDAYPDDPYAAARRDHDISAGASGAHGDESPIDAEPGFGSDYGHPAERVDAARDDEPSWHPAGHAEAAAVLADDFDEPDVDDPADEPLPQSVRPADAVRIAQLGAEVLVVDGRPRYHLPDCAHLVGRLTEPIPVNEAVELGFSPCGLCRPVDRLVAAAARH